MLRESTLTWSDSATSGFVNLYSGYEETSTAKGIPKKLKTLGNLVTPISTLRFNADSQLLAIASSSKKDQMRLVSAPTFLLVFSIKLTRHSDPYTLDDGLRELANI